MTKDLERVHADIPAALKQFDSLPDFYNVGLPIVAALNGISAPTVWRWVMAGCIPHPRKFGPNTTAWNVDGRARARLEDVK